MITISPDSPVSPIPIEKIENFERIYREHFKSNGYQLVHSDDIIFLLSELAGIYFPYVSKVSYTKECNTSHT